MRIIIIKRTAVGADGNVELFCFAVAAADVRAVSDEAGVVAVGFDGHPVVVAAAAAPAPADYHFVFFFLCACL